VRHVQSKIKNRLKTLLREDNSMTITINKRHVPLQNAILRKERLVIITSVYNPGDMSLTTKLDNVSTQGAIDLIERGILGQLKETNDALESVGGYKL
jgi:ABC-type phosphate transport system auxiliary subunit